jgi:hypothetical protein
MKGGANMGNILGVNLGPALGHSARLVFRMLTIGFLEQEVLC